MSSKESIELYTQLHRLGRQLFRVSHREWHEHGRYRGQYRLLRLIADNDGVIQRDLADEMDMRPSSMTEMLSRMEQMGLIRREPDEKDQRAFHIHLTEAGRAMAEEAAGATEGIAGEMFKNMTEEEIAAMLGFTKKLGANLDAMVPVYGPCGGRGERHHGCGGEGCHHHWRKERYIFD